MDIKKIGIVGSGTMGAGIAQTAAATGFEVVLSDIGSEYLERAVKKIDKSLSKLIEKGKLEEDKTAILERIQTTSEIEDLKSTDFVIEAVFEDLNVKNELFSKLDKLCDEKTILATNTSSFSVDEMSKVTNRPDRFVGLHFFYHPAGVVHLLPCFCLCGDRTTAG